MRTSLENTIRTSWTKKKKTREFFHIYFFHIGFSNWVLSHLNPTFWKQKFSVWSSSSIPILLITVGSKLPCFTLESVTLVCLFLCQFEAVFFRHQPRQSHSKWYTILTKSPSILSTKIFPVLNKFNYPCFVHLWDLMDKLWIWSKYETQLKRTQRNRYLQLRCGAVALAPFFMTACGVRPFLISFNNGLWTCWCYE